MWLWLALALRLGLGLALALASALGLGSGVGGWGLGVGLGLPQLALLNGEHVYAGVVLVLTSGNSGNSGNTTNVECTVSIYSKQLGAGAEAEERRAHVVDLGRRGRHAEHVARGAARRLLEEHVVALVGGR